MFSVFHHLQKDKQRKQRHSLHLLCYQFSCRVMRFLWLFSTAALALRPAAASASHACFHLFSSMLLASVHHPDFMAHGVSASRHLDSKLLVLLHVAHPSLASAGLVLGFNESCRRFAFRPTQCSPLRQSHYCCYPARPRRGVVSSWLQIRSCRPSLWWMQVSLLSFNWNLSWSMCRQNQSWLRAWLESGLFAPGRCFCTPLVMLVLYQELRVSCTVGEYISGLYGQVRRVSSGVVVHVWRIFWFLGLHTWSGNGQNDRFLGLTRIFAHLQQGGAAIQFRALLMWDCSTMSFDHSLTAYIELSTVYMSHASSVACSRDTHFRDCLVGA